MARTTQPIYYMATRPDGTLPLTSSSHARYLTAQGDTIPTVNLANHVGQIVDHPSPGSRWHDDKPFSYFHMYAQHGAGEVLERFDDGWPLRLFVVEPLGETGNWGGRHYPYWLMSHQIHVLEETEAWRAFGPRGAQVLETIEQLPGLARRWVAEWAADPQTARRTFAAWAKQVHGTYALVSWAVGEALSSRREAALRTASELARDSTARAATDAGVSRDAIGMIWLRARCLVAGQLVHDRLSKDQSARSIRDLLLGAGLQTSAPVTT